eukprot:4784038-Amphidinium_carterae.2
MSNDPCTPPNLAVQVRSPAAAFPRARPTDSMRGRCPQCPTHQQTSGKHQHVAIAKQGRPHG